MNDAPSQKVDPTAAKVVNQWKYDPSPLIACRFDPTGRYVFAGGSKTIWSCGSACEPVSSCRWRGMTVGCAIGFSSSGKRCWTAGYDGKLIEWDAEAESPVPLRQIDAHQGWIRSLDVSPDQKLLATGGNDHVVRIWDVGSGQIRQTCAGHDRHVYSVLFSPDGKLLFSGDLRGAVKRWDVETGAELSTLDAKQLYTPNPGQGAPNTVASVRWRLTRREMNWPAEDSTTPRIRLEPYKNHLSLC